MLLVAPAAAVGGGITTAVAVDGSATATDVSPAQASALAQQQNGTNETVRHRHPDEHNTEPDDLGGWLAGELAERLGDSSLEISQGQYETARGLLGEEYESQLEQYVEVTDADEEDEQQLRETRDKTERLADLLEAFEETRAAYEQAIEDEDADRARELARELVDIANRIEGLSVELSDLLGEIEAELGIDLTDALDSIETVSQDVEETRAQAIEETLTETELVVEAEQETVSFLDPLVITGQLRTVDGDPIADESIRLTVDGEPRTVTTSGDGTFTLEYRPTDTSLDADIPIEFVPANESVYLGSSATVTPTIAQVEPSLSLGTTPDTVQFSDEVTVGGDLSVEGTPVDDVELLVLLGGQQLGTLQVSDGTFEGAVSIPAAVPPGERTLEVRLPYEDRALAGVAERRSVAVRETETSLSMTAVMTDTGTGSGGVQLNGTLETVDGVGIAGASLNVRLDGDTVTTVTTDADGTFDGTVAVPADADEELVVTVAYPGRGNLGPSQTAETVTVRVEGSPGDDAVPSPQEDSTLRETLTDTPLIAFSLFAALAFVTVTAGVFRWYRRRGEDELPDSGGRSDAPPAATDEQAATGALFDRARDQLESGRPDRAIQVCYGGVRDQLSSRLDDQQALTHWEFYRLYRESGGSDADALRDVTTEYERATYSSEEVSGDTARTTLERARQLCDLDDGDSGSVADD